MDVIYIVSGFMRSGTSMMMRALEQGGIEAVFNASRDAMNDRYGDDSYKINDDGFYELDKRQYQEPEFPNNHVGKVVKCLWGGMYRLQAGPLKRVVFMRRPIEEIGRSYQAAFNAWHPQCIPELATKLDALEGILKMRRDIEISVVQYHDVIADPLRVFERLRDTGYPIDPVKSAGVVKPELYRHRHD